MWNDQGRELNNKLMQKWLVDNNVLMYSTYNEGKSEVAERLIRTLKGKINEKMTARNSHFYLDYSHKLVDEYNSTYHRSSGKKPIDADYSVLTEEIETNPKARKFKVGDRVRTTEHKNIFSKGLH